mmetsp:Transcript_14184/g.39004  ORF Transcript_14184/g.39004 Transcript_14184/m.39004 type:complete len:247 (+) Transcript_14184:547-1287(+)
MARLDHVFYERRQGNLHLRHVMGRVVAPSKPNAAAVTPLCIRRALRGEHDETLSQKRRTSLRVVAAVTAVEQQTRGTGAMKEVVLAVEVTMERMQEDHQRPSLLRFSAHVRGGKVQEEVQGDAPTPVERVAPLLSRQMGSKRTASDEAAKLRAGESSHVERRRAMAQPVLVQRESHVEDLASRRRLHCMRRTPPEPRSPGQRPSRRSHPPPLATVAVPRVMAQCFQLLSKVHDAKRQRRNAGHVQD